MSASNLSNSISRFYYFYLEGRSYLIIFKVREQARGIEIKEVRPRPLRREFITEGDAFQSTSPVYFNVANRHQLPNGFS